MSKTDPKWHDGELYAALAAIAGALSTGTINRVLHELRGWNGPAMETARDAFQERRNGRTGGVISYTAVLSHAQIIELLAAAQMALATADEERAAVIQSAIAELETCQPVETM